MKLRPLHKTVNNNNNESQLGYSLYMRSHVFKINLICTYLYTIVHIYKICVLAHMCKETLLNSPKNVFLGFLYVFLIHIVLK